MNIEEAKDLVDKSIFFGKSSDVIKEEVKSIIDQIEVQKPEECADKHKVVLSKEQAEYLETFGDISQKSGFRYQQALYFVSRVGFGYVYADGNGNEIKLNSNGYKDFLGSLEDKDELNRVLIEAIVNGYTVEKEKLYTVEIPNPNDKRIDLRLKKWIDGKVRIVATHSSNNFTDDMCLTEREIRKDFGWAWQWAEEVTE
ncbi:DUF1642 domain-containing protein [Streptococcus dysgalactiae]|uniref:DUF1642 domain-containing protein n=1 Tax=Streptococcus dysgalactiae TaxID=1334 RepID=UPI0035CEC661